MRSRQARRRPLDLVGIGLAASSTICSTTGEFQPANDYKADALRWWPDALGTFCTIGCAVLSRWQWKTALVTSMGRDEDGRALRRRLRDRDISLLFARATSETGRQLVIAPRASGIRYVVDRHVHRAPLTPTQSVRLARCLPRVRSAAWLLLDKYETDLALALFESERWRRARRRPAVLFDTGSRPRSATQAATADEVAGRGHVELQILPHVDVFTAPLEWVLALAHERGAHASGDRKDATPLEALLARVKDVLASLPGSPSGPSLFLVTAGSDGVVALWRDPTHGALSHRVLPPPASSDDHTVEIRLGAGDVFRAALVAGLLERGLTPQRLAALLAEGTDDSIVQVAQHAARRWIARRADPDYFGDFPDSYDALAREYEAIR